jgi:hypothetical protein
VTPAVSIARYRRDVRLVRVAPDDFTIDQYHPDVEGADPGGNRDKVVAQKLGSALFAELGNGIQLKMGPWRLSDLDWPRFADGLEKSVDESRSLGVNTAWAPD